MIIDNKVILPPFLPPSYHQSTSSPTSSSHSQNKSVPNLALLPPHLILQIIHHTFPPPLSRSGSPSSSKPPQFSQIEYQLSQPTIPEQQRRVLLWLSTNLRLVSRSLYTACMHILRSMYLPAYLMLIKPPYTSDPFPVGLAPGAPAEFVEGSSSVQANLPGYSSTPPATYSPSPSPFAPMVTSSASSIRSISTVSATHQSLSSVLSQHRETSVLDRFILLRVRQDVFLDDSEFHTERVDKFRDLFEIAQPKARLEDLVRIYGTAEGVVSVHGDSSARSRPMESRRADQNETGDQSREERTSTDRPSWAKGSLYESESRNSPANESQDSGPSSSISPPKSDSITTLTYHAPKPDKKLRLSLLFSFRSKKSVSPPASIAPISPVQAKENRATQHNEGSTTLNTENRPVTKPIPFSALSVSFSPRRVGLLYNKSRTLVAVSRTRGPDTESLETIAQNLVRELKIIRHST